MLKKRIGAGLLAFMISFGAYATPAFAHVQGDINAEATAEEMPEESERRQGKSEETKEGEASDSLTPAGNLTLVDDIENSNSSGKEFITVVTRSGNYFYIIIDRDDEGNNTVHFLNQVDEYDLMSIMDDNGKEQLKEDGTITDESGTGDDETGKFTEIMGDTIEEGYENKGEYEAEEERNEGREKENDSESAGKSLHPGTVMPFAVLVLAITGGIGFYIFQQVKKRKKNHTNPDPDYDDDEEDYGAGNDEENEYDQDEYDFNDTESYEPEHEDSVNCDSEEYDGQSEYENEFSESEKGRP